MFQGSQFQRIGGDGMIRIDRPLRAAGKAVLFALVLAAPARGAENSAPLPKGGRYNLIMISLGNVGTAHMSLYGYPRQTTPALDRWAKDAVVFENAFSPTSWTLPVGTSLFTSLYPFAHGVTMRGQKNMLNKSIPTLPEILQRAGYATAAFTGGLDYYKGFGHMRGFDTVADNPDFTGYQTTLPQATQWLSAHESKNFFLFIHGYDAHCPFVPPAAPILGTFTGGRPAATFDASRCLRGYKQSKDGYVVYPSFRCDLDKTSLECAVAATPDEPKPFVLKGADIDHLQDMYDEDVLSVDAQVGRFLASLSTQTLAQTIIVVYCEHGEMFAKHGNFGRPGAFRGMLYDDVVHIPLLVRLPTPNPARVRAMVSIVDIMPTLLDLLGIPNDARLKMQGKDLRPLIEGQDAQVHDRVYAGSTFLFGRHFPYAKPMDAASVRDPEWKLIREDAVPEKFYNLSKDAMKKQGALKPQIIESLYHVAKDPEELHDLAKQRPDVVARLKKDLRRWREECRRLLSERTPSTQKLPPSLLRSAKDHGYW